MHPAPIVVWLRRDLRINDNPALYHAAQQECPILPVFIWAPEEETPWAPGGAHKWWLHHSLTRFSESLKSHNMRLIVRQGPSLQHLLEIVEQTGAGAVYWNTRYEPAGKRTDASIHKTLKNKGIEARTFASHLLHQPDLIKTGGGGPYKVFTPYWKKLKSTLHVPEALAEPKESLSIKNPPASLQISDLQLLPETDWAKEFPSLWTPGEETAHERLHYFVDHLMQDYAVNRDVPSEDGTSRLSPHLHFGEISPRQIWQTVSQKMSSTDYHESGECYLREIAWREFSYHLLHHFPQTTTTNLRPAFDKFEWNTDLDLLKRWQKGQTGYPIVDAGMRQLWATGWMHNRVRMIVASFLTKHLLTAWQHGASWFWDTLVDGNLANNTMGWQWSAGSGADAQPFFRIFNPITQSQKFDANGLYIKEWVPELRALPAKYIHTPWTLAAPLQHHLNFYPGKTYPLPMVDHKTARETALDAYQKIR